jgi:hypothetical protein
MYGVFGGYTRWAVVFLIIFVLFFLFVPGGYGYGMAAGPAVGPGMTVAKYHGYNMMGPTMGMGTSISGYGYESPSSP